MVTRAVQYGYRPRARGRKRRSTVEIFKPTKGLDSSKPAQTLNPGFTPLSRNFAVDRGGLAPRSGLSQFGSAGFGAPVLGAAEVEDTAGSRYLLAQSANTVGLYRPAQDAWLSLTSGTAVLSGSSVDYFETAHLYDLTRDDNIAVFTNGINPPKWALLDGNTASYSDFTFASSFLSKARSVAAVDDRLVFFNVEEANEVRPKRVAWSVRGNPNEYSVLLGAGFEDLFDMQGAGQTIVPDGNGAVLFSNSEVWRAVPLRGQFAAFAFDFAAINRKVGCPYPRTAIGTPLGVMFLGSDLEVYLVRGNDVLPIGPVEQKGQSRIQAHLTETLEEYARPWAVYNTTERRYELYFSDTDSTEGYPNRSLYYDIETDAFLEQRFTHELTMGVDFTDPTSVGAVTWDQMVQTWNAETRQWNDIGRSVPVSPLKRVAPFSSLGTSYRMWSAQTSDDGTAIDCRWRSHGVGQQDEFNYDILDEVWLEYNATSNSSASVFVSADMGTTWDNGYAASLVSSAHSTAFAPVYEEGRAPVFEMRLNDGGQPRITRMQAAIRDSGKVHGGF